MAAAFGAAQAEDVRTANGIRTAVQTAEVRFPSPITPGLLTFSRPFRYSENNDYIGFKKIIHDARHPEEDAKPLPHPSTWFLDPTSASDPSPAGNEDDDLEVASERISTKCPITLLPMQDPVSSKKCPHSFEKQAIMGMINASRIRHPGPNGTNEKAVRCPVCEVVSHPFTSSEFHTPRKPGPRPTNSTYPNLTRTPSFSPPQTSSPIPS